MSATNTVFYPRATNAASVSLAVSSSAVSPAALSNAGALTGLIFFDVQNADVMCTLDGATAPTASVGHRLVAGTNYTWEANTFQKAKFIRQASTDARIQYQECSC